MSDDTSSRPVEPDLATPAPETQETESASSSPMSPAIALILVAMAILGVIIVMGVRKNLAGGNPVDNELSIIKAEVEARRNEVNRQRVQMGLAPLEGNSEPIDAIAKRLKSDTDTLVALSGRFQEMLSEKDAELVARNAEILRSEQLRQSLAAESTRLQGELQRALVSGSEVDKLRRDVADLKSQRDALASELSNTRDQLANMKPGASAEDFADLQRRYEETARARDFFENRVKELEGDLSKAKLFARSENELLPAAVELFRNLRELEGRPDSELTTSYSSLGVKLGANVLKTLTFTTGSSGLVPADQEAITQIAGEMPDGDLLLVIGYASETGNVEGNRKLSSDRATAVAEYYSSLKRPGQLVQAVYLGQTSRFSSRIPERNQLCEIWRIRKK